MPYVSEPNFGGLFDSLKQVAAAVIPKKTIVGKALSGDYSGAAAGIIKLAAGGGKKAPAPASLPPQMRTSGGPGLFAPGGFIEQNQTILLLVAAGLAVFLVAGRRKRK